MNCYVDSSAVLRKLLRQSDSLREWPQIKKPISNRLLRLECLRTVDRLRLFGELTDDQTAEYRSRLQETLSEMGFLPITDAIMRRAEEPFATPLGTLDSIHLATAILWREKHGDIFSFATHDKELGTAAKAHGFKVIGI